MKCLFNHVFSDGTSLSLAVDLSGDEPSMKSNRPLLENGLRQEYRIWLKEVVLPELYKVLTPAQLLACAVRGAKELGHLP